MNTEKTIQTIDEFKEFCREQNCTMCKYREYRGNRLDCLKEYIKDKGHPTIKQIMGEYVHICSSSIQCEECRYNSIPGIKGCMLEILKELNVHPTSIKSILEVKDRFGKFCFMGCKDCEYNHNTSRLHCRAEYIADNYKGRLLFNIDKERVSKLIDDTAKRVEKTICDPRGCLKCKYLAEANCISAYMKDKEKHSKRGEDTNE